MGSKCICRDRPGVQARKTEPDPDCVEHGDGMFGPMLGPALVDVQPNNEDIYRAAWLAAMEVGEHAENCKRCLQWAARLPGALHCEKVTEWRKAIAKAYELDNRRLGIGAVPAWEVRRVREIMRTQDGEPSADRQERARAKNETLLTGMKEEQRDWENDTQR